VVVYVCNPRLREVEEGGFQVQGQHGLHSKFQVSLSYIVRLCLKNIKKTKNTQNPKMLCKEWPSFPHVFVPRFHLYQPVINLAPSPHTDPITIRPLHPLMFQIVITSRQWGLFPNTKGVFKWRGPGKTHG
jgi:hypothetical protein